MENPPQFSAVVKPKSAKIGRPITVVIHVTNPGTGVFPVADPRTGTGSLVLRVTAPGDTEKATPLGALTGGVRPQVVNLQVLPGEGVDIDFELGLYVPLTAPGDHKLVLEYTWRPRQTWRSPELGFSLSR